MSNVPGFSHLSAEDDFIPRFFPIETLLLPRGRIYKVRKNDIGSNALYGVAFGKLLRA